jgi:hypothetical protein
MHYIDDPRKSRTVTESACKVSFFSTQFPEGDAVAIENVITDRCFLPQFVKGLSLLLKTTPRLRSDDTFLKSLEKSYTALLKNRRKDTPLWDKYAELNAPYAIYQTERAIEALCAFANLQIAVGFETTTEKAEQSIGTFDRTLVDAILRHAIVIRVGENDARSLISREVANETMKIRDELLDAVGRLATILDTGFAQFDKGLAQDGKSGQVAARELGAMRDEILGWADEFKVKSAKKP